MQAIYQYVDYRKYLRDVIAAKRRAMSSFSSEVLCRRAGGLKKSHFSLILAGKRNLSEEKAENLCRALNLSESESRYYYHLVRFNQARNSVERDFHLNAMLVESKRSRTESLPLDCYSILNSWHCMAILELARFPDFDATPKAIITRFRGLLSLAEAKQAIDILRETELLIEGPEGRLVPSGEVLRTTDEVTSLAIRKYHLSCLHLGRQVLDLDPVDKREFGSVNLLLNEEDRPRLKELIRAFREQVLALEAKNISPNTQVTQVNIQMFHISN